jgi:hypothetical protein
MKTINIEETKKQIRAKSKSQAEYFRQRNINPQSAATMLTARYISRWYPPKLGSELHSLISQLRKDRVLVFNEYPGGRRHDDRPTME